MTRHRLGLFEELGRSLKTTNCIKSLMALIGQRTDKVDYWRNSNQKQRWLATALMDIEPRLNRIKGCGYLPIKEGTTKRTWDKNLSGGCCIMKDLGGYKNCREIELTPVLNADIFGGGIY